MSVLRKKLIEKLEKISDVEIRLWNPDSDFTVINYKGKEVAHFHGNNELDIRLSKEVAKRDVLCRTSLASIKAHRYDYDGGISGFYDNWCGRCLRIDPSGAQYPPLL